MRSGWPETLLISSTWRLSTPGCTNADVTWIIRPSRAKRLRPSSKPHRFAGQADPLARDAVDRAAGREHVRRRERRDARVVAIVGVGHEIDRLLRVVDHADLVAEREVDRRGAELIGLERRDHEPPRVELGADRVAREDRHRRLARVIGRRMIP